ncbi:hypothetical protein FJZ39_04220 [Candidatus Saccharibacteria bacterium]|nr:hypothetical protein [Candidatus Saccharibacteria bacterium]
MKQFIISTVAVIATIASLALISSALVPEAAQAFNYEAGAPGGVESARGTGVPTEISGDGGVIQQIINILLFIIGIISVIMLIIGGLRYVVSGGKSDQVTAAKNTILYAIIGLVVAIFAYAIVRFVVEAVTGNSTGGTNV